MLKFLLVFISYSSLVYFRRIFFLFPFETSADINYSKSDYGNIISLFSICYTISKLCLGSLNDVVSPSKALSTSILAVSAALLGLSTSTSTNQLLLWVPLTSLFQGGAWLAAVKFLKQAIKNYLFKNQ
uniref:Uncharacterized protein n=1 Tax=Panagrolaimus sp. PS1159 TaxID=55785 RepID=A0AC35GNU5_9BILA